jgi:hypothetical protein
MTLILDNERKKKQVALDLIKQGKHEDAQKIYQAMIAAGTLNPVSYSNLAAQTHTTTSPSS